MRALSTCLLASCILTSGLTDEISLHWEALPDLPAELGVAGPYVGIHGDTLLVAGGANFPKPVWENDKIWHDEIYALSLNRADPEWVQAGSLSRPLGYGTTVSVPEGVVCIGGNQSDRVFDEVFLMSVQDDAVELESLPSLPFPLCYASSAKLGNFLYVAGGQTGPGLETAKGAFLRIDWSNRDDPEAFTWEEIATWDGPRRAFSSLATDESGQSLYLFGGRYLNAEDEVEFLSDLHVYRPDSGWKSLASAPVPIAAGTSVFLHGGHLVVAGGADGSLFARSDELKDSHPGFPRMLPIYEAEKNRWSSAQLEVPLNQVTTEAVAWKDGFILASGEIRPRVRTPKVWIVSQGKP